MTTEPTKGPRVGDELELTIEKLVAGGDGIGRAEGLPVFVSRSAPGDHLKIRVSQRKTDYARGEVVAVLRPGPDRREPPCPYFERCGGCDLQHLEDEAQVRHKVAATRETLERLGGVRWPESARIVTGAAWGYRLRAQFHLEADAAGGLPAVGYRERGSHALVPVDQCPILLPELAEVLRLLPSELEGRPPRRLDVAVGDAGAVTLAPPLAGKEAGQWAGERGGAVSRQIGGHLFWYDARCFFQAHAQLLPDLVDAVVGEWEGELACDLFAGVGLFGLSLADHYRKVVAVEGDRMAVRYHRRNLRENGVGSVEVISQAVESWIGALPRAVDRVIVDPPRMGLGRAVRQGLLAAEPRRITYVSCHPAALARDLRELLVAYRLESVTLLDLFPQTGHIEVVAQLGQRTAAEEGSAETSVPTLPPGSESPAGG
jgi:23S rRNA (uracil1939-C5)-methyltransferase